MTVRTSIAQLYPDRILVRGYNLVDMAGRCSFGATVYLLIFGELPSGREGDLIEAILVISAVHGIDSPSTHTARAVANCGVPLQSAVAAGISAIGEYHGGAGASCARMLQEAVNDHPDSAPQELARQIVARSRAQKQRLPGFGHRFHDPDPRADRLLALAERWGLSGRHTALARAIVDVLNEVTGRSLPLNVDGAIGALISDLDMDWRYGKALFILGRTAGLIAHVQEELETGKPFQFASKLDTEFVGVEERPLPPR
ncbi:MAG: citryl-CoA lyase [Candidatus Promineifilaceae bacterium]|nr:citryl-CoA lyase [Candidatus Promineifilaceae bacterium]